MSYNGVDEFDKTIESGDKCYQKAMMLICEKRYIEARAYFSDAISSFIKAENIAVKMKNDGLISYAKNKKEKAEQEREGAIDLFYEYDQDFEEKEM